MDLMPTGVIASAASGSVIKIASALLQNWFTGSLEKRRIEHEQRMAERNLSIKAYEIQTGNNYTNHTRRNLAYGVCVSLCSIGLYCTAFPDIVFFTLPIAPNEPTRYSILFGFFEWSGRTPSVDQIVITTGSMAYQFVHAAIMYLGFYFTPIGNK